MHFALVQARLKDAKEVYASLYDVLKSDIYYSSMVTDHNTNRGSNTYCTDTSIGMVGVINETLLFSNTGEIELLPALPQQWETGSIDGLMARTRAQVEKLSWDQEAGTVDAVIRSDIDQELTITSGMEWVDASIKGNKDAEVEYGEVITLKVKAGDTITLHLAQEEIPDVPELPYEDVAEGDWFYDAVEYTFVEGLMTGLDATHFGPYGNLSRAQFALILHRIEGEKAVETDKKFGDITGDEWYGPAVLWAAENGIVTGYENGNFGPVDLITREQMAVMMYRYAKYLKQDVTAEADLDDFKDAASVSSFATDAMKWAVGNGIITGKDGGTVLDPQGNTARSEAAIIIQRFMEK